MTIRNILDSMTTIINHQPRFCFTLLKWAICGHQQLPAEYFNWGTPHHVAKKFLGECSSGVRQRWGKGPGGFSTATPNPPTDLDYWGFSNPLLGAPQWGYPQEPRVNHDLLSFWFITVRNQSPAIGNLPFSDWKAVTKVRWAWKIPSQKPTKNTCFMPLTNRLMESCVMESFFGLHVGIAQNDSVSWCIYQLGYADFQNSVQW